MASRAAGQRGACGPPRPAPTVGAVRSLLAPHASALDECAPRARGMGARLEHVARARGATCRIAGSGPAPRREGVVHGMRCGLARPTCMPPTHRAARAALHGPCRTRPARRTTWPGAPGPGAARRAPATAEPGSRSPPRCWLRPVARPRRRQPPHARTRPPDGLPPARAGRSCVRHARRSATVTVAGPRAARCGHVRRAGPPAGAPTSRPRRAPASCVARVARRGHACGPRPGSRPSAAAGLGMAPGLAVPAAFRSGDALAPRGAGPNPGPASLVRDGCRS